MDANFRNSKFRKLNKSVYRLVHYEKNFYLEMVNYLKYKVYEGEPCILNPYNIKMMVGLYVYYLIFVGELE